MESAQPEPASSSLNVNLLVLADVFKNVLERDRFRHLSLSFMKLGTLWFLIYGLSDRNPRLLTTCPN